MHKNWIKNKCIISAKHIWYVMNAYFWWLHWLFYFIVYLLKHDLQSFRQNSTKVLKPSIEMEEPMQKLITKLKEDNEKLLKKISKNNESYRDRVKKTLK